MLDQLVEEANRQFTICNACRYCEGLCTVFPAMEMRTVFAYGDVSYLSALCHDCGACVPACPFSPPHEMAVDVRTLLAEARVQTFEDYARPQALWRLLAHGRSVAGIIVVTIVFATIVALSTGDPSRIVETNTSSGSFYDVIGWLWLVVPATVVSIFALVAILVGVHAFSSGVPGGARRLWNLGVQRWTIRDVLSLRNLDGGGGGCETVGDRRSASRRYLHHLIFYGFFLMFAATVAAAIQQDIFGQDPPYPIVSAPVLLGTIGGIATTIGITGFLVIGIRRRDESDGRSSHRQFDRVFGLTLLAATVTGLLTLALRSTPLMGVALIVHLGTLGGLYLTLPYSKFVHAFYRYVALARSHVESNEAHEPDSHAAHTSKPQENEADGAA